MVVSMPGYYHFKLSSNFVETGVSGMNLALKVE